MAESGTTHVNLSPASVRSDDLPRPVVPAQPDPIGRVVFRDGLLFIDGVAVCPLCREDLGDPDCVCDDADLLAGFVAWGAA